LWRGSEHGIRAVEIPVAYNGWFARHEFDQLPHVAAKTKEDLDAVLGDVDYWLQREIEAPEPD